MNWCWALAGSYLLGSFPTAYVVVKRIKRVDVRTVGSGNVGATNVGRVAGKGAGAFVFVVDLLKGYIAARWLSAWLVPSPTLELQLACGLAAILGHNFPVFLGFRGGKGVATTIGVLLGAMPAVAASLLLIWLVVFALWRYVSLASLAAAVAIPIAQAVMGQRPAQIGLGAVMAGLIIVRHRANIQRLRQGIELRAGASRRT